MRRRAARTIFGLMTLMYSTAAFTAGAQAQNGEGASSALYQVLGKYREASRRSEHESALKTLERSAEKFNAVNEGLLYLLRGRSFERLEKREEALAEYGKGLTLKSPVEAQLRFSFARVAAALGRVDDAKSALNVLLATAAREPGDVPQAMKLQTIFEYEEQLAKAEKWKQAIQLLGPALKRAKGSEIYSSLIYSMFRAKRKTGISDCRLARDLYAKYPALPQLRDWGPLLPENTVEGLKPSCSATTKDIQTRLRRLQLSGQIERSLAEIKVLRERGVFDAWTTDTMEVNALLSQGQNVEALKMLLKHVNENVGRPAFWMLLGKISSRLGDFAGAAGAYKKAHDLSPGGRTASDSLFNSAFASYQMQDYDGAEAGFEKLSRKFGRSKIARDARWHLAWMSYLRHDYALALARWEGLLNERSKGRRRSRNSGDATSFDRIQYWSAMALMQLGRSKEAVERLRELVKDPSIDYYSILAWYRLRSLASNPALGIKLSDAETKMVFRPAAGAALDVAAEAVDAAGESVASDDVEGSDISSDSSGEANTEASSESSGETGGDNSAEANAAVAAITAEGDLGAGVLNEPVPSSNVRDPALQRRLERVRLLFAAGLEEETRWELQNLDQRVRHPQDRRTMMAELHRMGRWDRSSVLAELTFGVQRIRGGLDGARELWEFAYPRAWQDSVPAASRSASVDEDLVWSIMRAESHYRAEARSPVGASGLMQIMPFTGERVAKDLLGRRQFQATELFDPETNIRVGSRYLRRLGEKFANRIPLVAASYNAGPHRVQTWLTGFGSLSMDAFIEHIPFVETRNYVKKVTRNFQIYRLLYKADQGSLGWLVGPIGVSPQDGPGALDVW